MPKAKKSKPAVVKLRKPMDPERAARLRRVAVHATAILMVLTASACMLVLDRRYVEHTVLRPVEPPKVVLKNRPVWMTEFLAEQIARVARPAGTHSAFDHRLLVDTVTVLRANPWIKEVRQVRRVYGTGPADTLEVDCDYRAPVALVHWKDYYWLVDSEGVKLPEAFGEQLLPRIQFGRDHKINIRVIEGVNQAPPESGTAWGGEDLKAGIELVKLLYGKPYAEEIDRVSVANFDGRRDAKGAHLVLMTKYNTEIRWGRPVATGVEDYSFEVLPEQKLKYMEAIFNEHHRIDANYAWVDLRFDEAGRPSTDKAQTAATEIQR